MPNYNLGVAHGSIKITSDNAGATQTLAALKALRDAQGDYDKALKNSAGGSKAQEKAARNMAEASDNLAKRSRALEAALLPLAAAGRAAASGLEKMSESALPAAKKIIEIQKAIKGAAGQLNELTSAVGLTKAAFAQLNDYEQTLAWLVDMAKKISEAASKFLGFAAAGNAVVKALQKVAASSGAVAVFGRLASMAAKVRWSFIGAGIAATQVGQRASVLLPVLQRVGAAFGFITGPIGLLAAASPRLQRAIIGISAATSAMSSRMGAASPAVRRLGSALQAQGPVALKLYNSLIKVASGITGISLGVALLSRGLKNFGRVIKIGVLGVSALSAGAALVVPVMSVLGTTVKGAFDALKQMSGAALILPGALTALGIAGGTAKLAFMGITDAFKAGALSGEEFDAAIKSLSPKMQEVAKAAQALSPAVKELRDNVQNTALNGFTENMASLAQTYLPVLNTGLGKTSEGLRSIIQGFVNFAQQPATITDISNALNMTSVMMQRVGQSIHPVLSAFRDIGTVGLEALTAMTGGMSTAAANFGNFIAMARGNGDLRRWIDEGIAGFKDLGSTIASIGSGINSIFGAFGADGDNALARMAAGAEKLEASMTRLGESDGMSALVAGLSRISDTVFSALTVGAKELGEALVTLGPYAERVSNAFGQRMIQVFQTVGNALNTVAEIMNRFAGSADIVGYLLGTAAAMGIIKIALIPIIRGLQAMAGAFAIVSGAAKLFQGSAGAASAGLEMMGKSAVVAGVKMGLLGTALARVGAAAAATGAQAGIMSRISQAMVSTYAIGARAANVYAGGLTNVARAAIVARAALAGMGVAAKGALAAIGGPVGAALIAATVGMMAFSSASSAVKAANEAMANSAQHAQEGITGLVAAFAASNGEMSTGVFEEMTEQIGTFRDDLAATAATSTGVMADIGAGLKDMFSMFGGDALNANRDYNESIDEMAAKAQKAAAAFNELGMSNEQISAAITGTDADFAAFSNTLKGLEGGAEALDAISAKRDTFVAIRDSMAGASDGAVQMGEALRVLGDAGSSAADQLNAVKSALQSMGLMTLNAQEAFAQYQEGLAEFGNAAGIAIDSTSALGNAMLNADGSLNLVNNNARDLRDSVIGLADGMIQSVNAGQNADEAWSQMQPALQNLANAYQLPLPAIQALAASAGAVPEVLNMLVSLKGAPEATQQLVNLGTELNQVPVGTTVNVKVNDVGVLAAIKAVGGAVGEVDGLTGQVDITAPNQSVLDAINAIVAAARQPMNGKVSIDSNAPAVAGTVEQIKASLLAIPPQTIGTVTITGAQEAADNAQRIAEQLSAIVGNVQATVTASGLPAVALDSEAARAALANMEGQTTVMVSAPGMDAVATNAAALSTAIGGIPPTKDVNVTAPGLPQAATDANAVKTAIEGIPPTKTTTVTANGLPQIATDAAAATTAIEALPPTKTITIDAVGLDAGPYQQFGTAVEQAMNQALSAAQNMASGVSSALAGAAAGAYSSGSALGSGFAAGIQSQVGAVAAAAAALAEAASAPLPRSPAKIGPFSGRGWTPFRGKSLGVGFAQGITSTVGDVRSAALGAAEAASGALSTATSAVAKVADKSSGGNQTVHKDGVTSGAGFGQAAKSAGGFGIFGGLLGGLLGGLGRMFTGLFSWFKQPDVVKMGQSAAGLRKVNGDGKILSVLDQNKQVISRFHEKASWDRQSGPGQVPVNNTNNNKSTGVENMNIYAGPGQDPYQLVEQAMFQVNVASKGKY